MTAENFKKGMLILRETFPERFGEMDETTMKVWFQILNDIPNHEWEFSVLYICRNHAKPPVPATLRQIAKQNADVLGAEEAWAIVWDGVRLGQHKYDDPIVQKTYDAIGYQTWRNLTYSDASAVRAHFYRTYEAMKKRVEMDEEMLAIEYSKGFKLVK